MLIVLVLIIQSIKLPGVMVSVPCPEVALLLGVGEVTPQHSVDIPAQADNLLLTQNHSQEIEGGDLPGRRADRRSSSHWRTRTD